MRIVALTKLGTRRVHNGQSGMLFVVHGEKPLDHSDHVQLIVRDYRYPSNFGRFSTWVLWPEDYEEIRV